MGLKEGLHFAKGLKVLFILGLQQKSETSIGTVNSKQCLLD